MLKPENGLYFLYIRYIVTAGIDSLFPPAETAAPQLDKMDPASTVTFNDGVLASSWPTASARNAWRSWEMESMDISGQKASLMGYHEFSGLVSIERYGN